jgi:flagellar M-ring protein FliF
VASIDIATILPRRILDRVEPVLRGRGRATVVAGGALAATIIITAVLWSSGSSYSVLYAGLSGEEGGRTLAELQKLNIPYQITEGGRVILVPAADVGRARLQLAARGVPKQDSDQWALLDNESLGVSPFVEQVHYIRALEAGLSRTVREVDGVVSATVKLALPKQTEFLADAPKPSASVMVRLRPGLQLTTAQIDGLMGLIAGSVAGLTRDNVTIVDQSGKVLNVNSKDALQQGPQQLEIAREVARRYEISITDLLIPVLGRGNFRVAADADVDFSQVKESSVKYGDSHVLSQDETIHTHPPDGELAIGIPGALSNRRPETPTAPANTQTPTPPANVPTPAPPPNVPNNQTPANSPAGQDKPETPPDTHRTTNYDIDKTVQFLERPFWKLRAINVAVLVNNPSGKALPAERIQSVDTLVRSAIGAGGNRHVSVVDLPFAEDEAPPADPRTWWKEPWVVTVGQNAALALAGLLVLFGGVLPLLRRVTASEAAIAELASTADLKAGVQANRGRVSPRDRASGRDEPALNLPSGSRAEAETVRQLVANDPARTAQVIKEWLTGDRSTFKQAS